MSPQGVGLVPPRKKRVGVLGILRLKFPQVDHETPRSNAFLP